MSFKDSYVYQNVHLQVPSNKKQSDHFLIHVVNSVNKLMVQHVLDIKDLEQKQTKLGKQCERVEKSLNTKCGEAVKRLEKNMMRTYRT